MRGKSYVLLWRKIQHTSFYRKPLICHLAIHLILRANYTATTTIFNNQVMTVGRGEFIAGRLQLAEETGLTENEIRTSLRVLTNVGFISVKTTNRFSLIRICKYDDYQAETTNKSPTSHQQVTNKSPQVSKSNKKKEVSTDVDTKALARRDDPTQQIIDTWTRVYGQPPRGGNVKTHWPAKRLADAYTAGTVCKAIEWAEANRRFDQYMPVFNNLLDLEQKWNGLKASAERLKQRSAYGGTLVIE